MIFRRYFSVWLILLLQIAFEELKFKEDGRNEERNFHTMTSKMNILYKMVSEKLDCNNNAAVTYYGRKSSLWSY